MIRLRLLYFTRLYYPYLVTRACWRSTVELQGMERGRRFLTVLSGILRQIRGGTQSRRPEDYGAV